MKKEQLLSAPTIEELAEFVSGKLPTDRANEIQLQAKFDAELNASIEDLRAIARLCFGRSSGRSDARK